VTTARPNPLDPEEPQRLAEAVDRLHLKYVVITSVARDDLPDEGSGHFARCIRALHERIPGIGVEVLTPDFHARRQLLDEVVQAQPEVFAHNVETVERLTPKVRPQADYRRSLETLRLAKEVAKGRLTTKSGLMVGLGEGPQEMRATMRDLRQTGCEILTIGQYLRPGLDQRQVEEFVPLEQFDLYREWGRELGFSSVTCGPYVRSSYNAFEAFQGKENPCTKRIV